LAICPYVDNNIMPVEMVGRLFGVLADIIVECAEKLENKKNNDEFNSLFI